MPNNNPIHVIHAEQSEAARAAQNRALVREKLGEAYYREQESAIEGWEIGEPAPEVVRLGGSRELD
jgi:hypothetical protein